MALGHAGEDRERYQLTGGCDAKHEGGAAVVRRRPPVGVDQLLDDALGRVVTDEAEDGVVAEAVVCENYADLAVRRSDLIRSGLVRPGSAGQAGRMDKLSPPLRLLILMFAGWVNREQQAVIDYLREENAVLREQMGGRRLRLNDDHHGLAA